MTTPKEDLLKHKPIDVDKIINDAERVAGALHGGKEEEIRQQVMSNDEITGIYHVDGAEYNVSEKKLLEFILKIRREAISEVTKQIEEFAHKEMKDGNLAYEKLLILLAHLTQE